MKTQDNKGLIKKIIQRFLALSLLCFASLLAPNAFAALTKGIYLTQYTLEDTPYLNYLIEHSKAVGINTFIVDLERPSKRYHENLALLKRNNISYVARIVIFPGGGTKAQVSNPSVWQEKYSLVKQAVDWGADQIQLDYIRYNTEQAPTAQNARDIHHIIQWYKARLAAHKVPLQLDIFGIASFGPSVYIGQDIKLFSSTADAICPMVYPSHFEPFRQHAVTPYDTIYGALTALRDQFPEGKIPFKLYPYIELSNYRYPLSHPQRLKYIVAEIRAAEDAGADGWYVWSPHNEYDSLFEVLESNKMR
jgi:hypothetical protein